MVSEAEFKSMQAEYEHRNRQVDERWRSELEAERLDSGSNRQPVPRVKQGLGSCSVEQQRVAGRSAMRSEEDAHSNFGSAHSGYCVERGPRYPSVKQGIQSATGERLRNPYDIGESQHPAEYSHDPSKRLPEVSNWEKVVYPGARSPWGATAPQRVEVPVAGLLPGTAIGAQPDAMRQEIRFGNLKRAEVVTGQIDPITNRIVLRIKVSFNPVYDRPIPGRIGDHEIDQLRRDQSIDEVNSPYDGHQAGGGYVTGHGKGNYSEETPPGLPGPGRGGDGNPQEVVIGPRQDMALEATEDTRTEKVTPEDLDQVEDQAEDQVVDQLVDTLDQGATRTKVRVKVKDRQHHPRTGHPMMTMMGMEEVAIVNGTNHDNPQDPKMFCMRL